MRKFYVLTSFDTKMKSESFVGAYSTDKKAIEGAVLHCQYPLTSKDKSDLLEYGLTFSREINYKLELIELNATKLAGYNYSLGKSK